MAPHTATPAVDGTKVDGTKVDGTRVDAVALAGRLQRGQPLPTVELEGLPADEQATLETTARLDLWRGGRPAPVRGDESSAPVIVTDRRILVEHPQQGVLSLWHVDLENLQLGRTGQQWHLDLHPVGINPRARLTGGAAPLVALHVARAVFPHTWARLSGLLPLLGSAA